MSVPTTVGTITTQNNAPSAVISFSIAEFFNDADATATKSYGATGLPTGLSISSTTGAITGTPSAAGGTYSVVLTCTPSSGTPESRSFSWIIAGAPTAAQNYYINGGTGNDSWDGLSATFVSGTNGPWATITRANNVQPHASGHVDINIAPGTYRNQVYVPAYSGTDDSHRIRLRVTSDGIVDWMGPSSGSLQQAFWIGDAWDSLGGGVYQRNYISILQTSATQFFRWDGEMVFGFGGGEAAKGEDVTAFGHLQKLGHVNGVGIVLEGVVRRTVGWSGLSMGAAIDNYVQRLDWEQHGTSHHSDGNDFGDSLWIDHTIPVGS